MRKEAHASAALARVTAAAAPAEATPLPRWTLDGSKVVAPNSRAGAVRRAMRHALIYE